MVILKSKYIDYEEKVRGNKSKRSGGEDSARSKIIA